MSLEFCVLASGSSGNCAVLRTPAGVMLIDSGINPRTVSQRLDGTEVRIENVSAICLTHLDHDHFSATWVPTVIKNNIRVYCHGSCVAALLRIGGSDDRLAPLITAFAHTSFEPFSGLTIQPISLAHDDNGSHGFLFDGFGGRIGYATDLGYVTDELIEQFANLNVLAIESNYDPQMQEESLRPDFLKKRITGGRGHLSNEQAFKAVRQILNKAERGAFRLPAHIVLLHRSRQCNSSGQVTRLFSTDARIPPRLVLAEQFRRTQWLSASRQNALAGEQLLLAWR